MNVWTRKDAALATPHRRPLAPWPPQRQGAAFGWQTLASDFAWILITMVALAMPLGAASQQAGYQPPLDCVFIAEHDQTEQRYVVLLPGGYQPGEARDLLIALHGHGSDRWQFVTQDRDECRGARDAAAAGGMLFVSPDYRATTSWMGPAAEQDLLQIIALLKATYVIRRVVLCGGSMGATAALTFTALHPDLVDGVVALNGTANQLEYENFQDAIRTSFGGEKRAIPETYWQRSAEYWPHRFTMPVALTTSGQDTAVPPDSVQRLSAILKKLQPNVLHIHRPQAGHATSYADTVMCIRYVLEHLPPSEQDAPPGSFGHP